MENVWIVRCDRLRFGLALKGWNHMPEMVEHGIGGRVPVVGSPVHLPTGNDVDARNFLLKNSSLAGALLSISEIARCQLPGGDEPV
jgi:hypothetical protein